jgi:hypothetical protein
MAKESTIESLKQFDRVILQCSIDGIGEHIEFQRFPCKWSVIERNFRRFLQCGFEVSLTPCWSQLNALGVVNFLNWASEFDDIFVAYNEVMQPSYLDFRLIPIKYRETVISSLNNCRFPKLMHKDYFKFFEALKKQQRSIITEEKQALNDAVNIWNFNNDIKYQELYPWAKDLLE